MGGRERLFGGDQLEAEVQATSLSAQSSLGRKCPTMARRQDKGRSGPAGLGAVAQTREEFTERGELIQAPGEGV